ncbi:MAG: hypothetical protein ACYTFT_03935, partial [Planctomycetota bacterium]
MNRSISNRLLSALGGVTLALLSAPALAGEIQLDDVRIAPGTESATATNTPWSGTWWPFQSGKLAKGYHGPANFTYDSDTETFTEVAGIDKNELAPLRKYDEFMKLRHGTDPRSAWLELQGDDDDDFHHHVHGARKQGFDDDGVNYSWWGHCNGWAAAAVMEREPFAPITAEGIRFEVADLKGLLSESYWGVRSDFTGRRYNKPSDEMRAKVTLGADLLAKLGESDEPPVADYIAWYEDIFSRDLEPSVEATLDANDFKNSLEYVRDWAKENWEDAYKDIAPDVFHKILVSTIKNRGMALVFDTSANEEVWNFPCYWYETDIRFAEDLADGQKKYNVTTHAKYAHDGVSESIIGVNELPKTYHYTLITDAEGRPVGGEWTGVSVDEHPDFAWLPTLNILTEDTGENPRLLFGKLLEILQEDHDYGTRDLELQARDTNGGWARQTQHIQPESTTTWTDAVAVTSPVGLSVIANSRVTKVTYFTQRVNQGSRFATARLNGLNQLGEVTSGGSFEGSYALTNGKHMVVAKGFASDGRLVAVSEITVQVGGSGTAPTDDRFEQNDTSSQAASIQASAYPGLRCNDDDWFKVTVPANTALTVTIDFSHSEG